MIWVIANNVEEDGSFPTYRHYKNAFNEGEIDIYCAKQDDDFSFLKKDDIAFVRTRDENINLRLSEAQRKIGFKSTLESQFTNLLTYDKELVKLLLYDNGIPHPRSFLINEVENGSKYFVKPRYGENSIGIDKYSICSCKEDVEEKCKKLTDLGIEPMIEEYIDGKDITCSVFINVFIGESVFSAYTSIGDGTVIHTEIDKQRFSFKTSKCFSQKVDCIARRVFKLIGARHLLRIDFRIKDGIPYVIDINMIPGLAPNGYMAECMKAHGIDYYSFIKMLVNTAY